MAGRPAQPFSKDRKPRQSAHNLIARLTAWSACQWRSLFVAVMLASGVLPIIMIARAQPVTIAAPSSLSSSRKTEGCLQKTPAPPTSVQAIGKEGKVVLTWSPPTDGSCVDLYLIDAYDDRYRSAQQMPVQSSSTDGSSYTMTGLQDGIQYRFRIQAYNSDSRTSGSTEVLAAPDNRCQRISPGNILNFRVTPGSKIAQLCWDGVDNDACVDEYRVSAIRVDSQFRSSEGNAPISKGGCANISSLEDGVQYKFYVLAFSNQFGEGPAASTTAYVGASQESRNGWTCNRQPTCRPNTLSLCAITGCRGATQLGGCKGPAMYDISYGRKQVTQWCSDVCDCDLSVASAFRPVAWGLTQGMLDSAGSFLGINQSPGTNNLGSTALQLVPSLMSGAAQGFMSGIQGGKTLGSGLAANVVGNMMQATVDSGVIGDTVGAAVARAADTMVSSVVNSIAGGVMSSLTGANSD